MANPVRHRVLPLGDLESALLKLPSEPALAIRRSTTASSKTSNPPSIGRVVALTGSLVWFTILIVVLTEVGADAPPLLIAADSPREDESAESRIMRSVLSVS